MNILNGLCVVGFLFLSGIGCRSTNDVEKIAEVDGVVISRTEVYSTGGKQLHDLREQLFRLERQKLDEYIDASLLTREAKNQGLSVAALLDREINGKVETVSEADIRSFYDKNKDRIPLEFDKVHDQVRDYLHNQKMTLRKTEYFKSLRAKAIVKTYLSSPPISRVKVSVGDAFSKGADKALVQIVKFEDFQCPYCKIVQPRFGELLKKYEGKVKIVHKDLPLESIHPQARQAAEAARCAAEQGKFWEYHDKLYLQSPKLSVDNLKAYANDIGLDRETFDGCFTSGRHKAAVQKDLIEGADLGITGTPTFFINGRELTGGQSLEAFSAIIDEELALAK